MKSDKQYATMESLDAFTTGWGLVSSVYLTVHKISPKLVTHDAYKNQVATARTEIMESGTVCYKAHCDQIKIDRRSIAHGYHHSSHSLLLTFKGETKSKSWSPRSNVSPTSFFEHMEKPFRDCLANSFTKFLQDRIEPRIPVLPQV